MQTGLDSLGTVQLQSAISDTFGLALPATVTFDHPTFRALAAHINIQLEPPDLLAGAATSLHLAAPGGVQPAASVTALAAVSCRYPSPGGGVQGAAGFVETIGSGQDLQDVVPSSRWDVDTWYHPSNQPHRMYVRFGAWLEGIDQFDSAAFRLAPR